MQNCLKLQSLGVLTPEPIGYVVDKTWFGLPRRSLYAAKWIEDSVALDRFEMKKQLAPNEPIIFFRELLTAIGKYIARLNQKKIIPYDLNAGNLLVKRSEKDCYRFYLVDYERISFPDKVSKKAIIVGLSQMAAFFLPRCKSAVEYICKGYTTALPHIDLAELIDKVDVQARYRTAKWEKKLDQQFTLIAAQIAKEKSNEI